MTTQHGEGVQRAEKNVLKRKLTGPPRLLLGKTRTRSAGGDRSAPKYSDIAKVTETANVESSGGRCGDDIRNKKVSRRSWGRRFSSSVVCNRKQKKDVNKGSAEQQSGVPVPPEGALQETDAAFTRNTEEDTEVTKGKRRFNMRAWPTARRFLTSSDVRRTHKRTSDLAKERRDDSSTTFREKLRKFFTKGGKSRSSGVALENLEDRTQRGEELPRSSEARGERHGHVTTGSLEVVAAQISQLTEEQEDSTNAGGSDGIQTEAGGSDGIQNEAGGSEGIQTEAEDPVKDLMEETTSTSLQNGPSIRIELVPPDAMAQEDEDEEGPSSSENQNRLLLLLGLDHGERQLVQTARSLVRAAMNAAVDQLTREQLSDADCVHREPPGCRDHA